MSEIAMGTVVLNRVEKLSKLLESVQNSPVHVVYVADNGKMSDEKEALYSDEFSFRLEVIDMEYDIGLGACREQISETLDEEYLLMADSDHRITGDVETLLEVLEERPELGGVSGSIVEPERGRIWQSGKDFKEKGNNLVRSPHVREKRIETVAGTYFVEFEFIPYPTLYRKECVKEYNWDPEYPLGRAHVDFYLGHWKNTDWSFGLCPDLYFEHHPGGSDDYVSHRRDDDKYNYAKKYFREKWGYSAVIMEGTHWFDTKNWTLADQAYYMYHDDGPKMLLKHGWSWLKRNMRRS